MSTAAAAGRVRARTVNDALLRTWPLPQPASQASERVGGTPAIQSNSASE